MQKKQLPCRSSRNWQIYIFAYVITLITIITVILFGTVTVKTMSAKEAKVRFGEFLDAMQREPVIVTKNNRPVGVMVSLADLAGTYLADHFMEKEARHDEWLQSKVGASLARLQTEGSKGKPFEEVHAEVMDNVRLRMKNS